MDIEVISLIDGIGNNLNGVEDHRIYDKGIRKNKYYKINSENIKISVRQEKELLKYKSKAKRTVVLIKEINETNEEILLNYISNNAAVVITENYICKNKSLKYVNILRDIENSLSLDFEVFLFFITSNDIFKALPWNKGENTIIMGRAEEEKIVSKVVMAALNAMDYINSSKVIEVALYGKNDLSLKDIAYIEDPLKEYLNYNKLKIIQRKNEYTNKYVYFMLICSA